MNQGYFDLLQTVGFQEHLYWLTPLTPFVEKIVSFGCISSEPFALMITLNATEIKVVDVEGRHFISAQEELQFLRQKASGYFLSRSVEFIVGDMTETIASLPTGYFDLAFCENVFYNIYPNQVGLRNAIKEMKRIVKSNRWLIAVEPKIGAKMEICKDSATDWDVPIRISNPINISGYFEEIGLTKKQIDLAPKWSYCYQKID